MNDKSADGIKIPHICPNCKETASNQRELKEKFGYRTIEDYNIVTVQSWCSSCRSQLSKKL